MKKQTKEKYLKINRKKSVNLYYVKDINTKTKLDLIKKLGYDEFFTGIYDKNETLTFEQQIEYANSINLKCTMVHCQYFDDIMNNFWLENELGEKIVKSYLEQIKRSSIASKNFVVHLNDSRDSSVSEIGLKRIKILLQECEKYDINLCVENLNNPDEIPYIFKNLEHKNLKICFDVGHRNCLHPQFDVIKEYGEYIEVLHMHDNNGQKDEHKICFAGTVDWISFAKYAANKDWVLSAEVKTKNPKEYKKFLKQNLKSLIKIEKLTQKN